MAPPEAPTEEAVMLLVLRRARGVLVMALLWAAAWAVIGSGYGFWHRARFPVAAVIRDGVHLPVPTAASTALWWAGETALWGLACGAAFALLLATAERRCGGAATLPVGRAALWGALAALVGFGSVGAFALLPATAAAGVAALIGAVLAGGVATLARRAPAERLAAGAHVGATRLPHG
jgi:hypothetical protein